MWDTYQEHLAEARAIIAQSSQPLPALASICKQCYWRKVCREHIHSIDDLTQIPELGRAKRDGLLPHVETVTTLATFDVTSLITKGNKTIISGIGAGTLEKIQRRAVLLKTPGATPFLTAPFTAIDAPIELFFDVEVDPFRDICYLHGFLERHNRDNGSELFRGFFAETPTPEGERKAFADAVAYLRQMQNAAIYYYSPYERTTWNLLREKYPDVIAKEEMDAIFSLPRSMDLYQEVVRPGSEWPTNDFSVKTLAKFLGFNWRDTDPSGAASIEWYDNWVRTGDPTIRQRILEYNEDDCRATRILLDGLRSLPVAS